MFVRSKSLLVLAIASLAIIASTQTVNNRPIIAILTTPSTFSGHNDANIDSYVLGQDVRFIESGGSRVAWLNWNWTQTTFTNVLKSINGIVISHVPDASVSDTVKTKFQARVTQILEYADTQFNIGNPFPVYASGDAFKAVLDSISKSGSLFRNVSTTTSLKLNISQSSKLYSLLPSTTLSYVQSNFASYFGNTQGLSPIDFASDSILTSFFNIAATAVDNNGVTFIAALEGKTHPFYFLQYLPNSIVYDWTNANIKQNYVAQQAALAITNYFVNQTRSNSNTFSTPTVADGYLLYERNWTVVSAANPNVFFFHQS